MSATDPSSEIEALLHTVDRLTRRFPTAGEDVVRDMVVEETASFDRAGLRDYIPVLVEGRVLRRLRDQRLPRAS